MDSTLSSYRCMQLQQRPNTGRSGRGRFPPTGVKCLHCRSTLLGWLRLNIRRSSFPPPHPCHHYCWSVGTDREGTDQSTHECTYMYKMLFFMHLSFLMKKRTMSIQIVSDQCFHLLVYIFIYYSNSLVDILVFILAVSILHTVKCTSTLIILHHIISQSIKNMLISCIVTDQWKPAWKFPVGSG